jgi:hypothetical protein
LQKFEASSGVRQLPAFLRRGGCDINKMATSLAEQTGRLVKTRSLLMDFREALLLVGPLREQS